MKHCRSLIRRGFRTCALGRAFATPKRARLVRLDNTGRIRDTVGEYDAGIGWIPFALFVDGLNVAAHQGRLYIGDGSRAEVSIRKMSGALLEIIRWRDRLEPVTRTLVRRMADTRLPRTVTGADRSAQVEAMTGRPHRDSLPAYSNLRVDKAGRLWVRDNTEGRQWTDGFRQGCTVFNPDGSLLGRFEPPRVEGASRVSVTQVGADYIVLRAKGDNGVEVFVYGIAPVTPGR